MVERYEFTCHDSDPDAVNVNHGRYVRYSDYATLAAENEALKERLATAYRVKADCNDEANFQRARANRVEASAAVKVLRWKGPDWAGEYHSLDGLWGYIIRAENGNGYWLAEVGAYYPSVEDAQAAAQADYERRILSALTAALAQKEVKP